MRDRTKELAFLVACAAPRGRLDPGRLTLLARAVDWDQIELFAVYHRVRPLLFRRVFDHGLANVERRREWEASFRAYALHTMGLTGSLVAVAKAFAFAGIPVLPHKGPLLAIAAYGELGLREFADLDLLVGEDALGPALEILAALDYTPETDLAWVSAEALRRWTGECACVSASGVTIDLHWRLTPPGYPVQLDPTILWPHTTKVDVAGAKLTTLAPEALFLLLAVHGAKHAWEAMGWLADLAWLIDARPNFDWSLTGALAAEAGCTPVLRLAAHLIAEVFGTTLSVSLGREVATDRRIRRLAARVRRRWRKGQIAPPGTLELLHFVAALSPGPLTTLRHFVGLVVNPTEVEWSARRLPEKLFFLYLPGRLLRLAVRRIAPRRRRGG